MALKTAADAVAGQLGDRLMHTCAGPWPLESVAPLDLGRFINPRITAEKQDETGPSALRSVAVGPYPRSLQGFAPLAEVPE